MTAVIAPGFGDGVRDSQRVFRSVLDALANPGRVETIDVALAPPPSLHPASAALLLALADFETPVWLSRALPAAVGDWLRFHTAAPIVADPGAASFAILAAQPGEPDLSAFPAGDDLYPDRSATVILQCRAMSGGEPVDLTGPGIRDRRQVAPAGLPPAFWRQFAESSGRYPRGVDIVLAAGALIMGLPRSARIEMAARTGEHA